MEDTQKERINELALFAGAGGGILGSILLGPRVVCAVEINSFRREVLLRRQRDGMLPLFPIWDDVRTFDGKLWRGKVDLVTAGFPCQPFSQAGLKLGEDDPRNLWPQTKRIISEVAPAQVFLENVPGIMQAAGKYYIFTVLADLAEIGYEALPPLKLGAGHIGANHRRNRIWILANSSGVEGGLQLQQGQESIEASGEVEIDATDSQSDRCEGRNSEKQQGTKATLPRCEDVPNIDRYGLEKQDDGVSEEQSSTGGWWTVEPGLDRLVYGMANRVERIEALGDGQVPSVVAMAWRLLSDPPTNTWNDPT